tara:strand:+ start:265 stop:2211 length:1947 start_codon:yes stop_codon:yes gene_type:complete
VKINYRSEIDGLRAIAVGAVILYHAQISILGHNIFKGGFIGVDIFFVISGYLITSIILKELISTGSFSFRNFYERRIRRLLPALLLVMLASLPFAWFYLMPSDLIEFSKSIIYSLSFGSNFYFHYSGQEYGTTIGLYKPFLHTWSLSVEEQYYILFPILFFLVFKYFRKYLPQILILGLLASLGFADWTSRNYTSVSFYFLHTRMWELLAGSLLAYFEVKLGHRSKHKKLNLIFPSVGLFLIGYSILFFNDRMLHPSLYTLIPVIGVCLIIWFTQKNEIITKLLSTKLFVGIGLISYSMYLWHYPVFAFSRITYFTENNILRELLLMIIIFTLSIITYYFIERPARNRKFKFKYFFILIIISSLSILVFNMITVLENGFKNRYNNEYSEIYIKNNLFNRQLSEETKQYHKKFNNQKFQSTNKIKVLIIGNSHSVDLFNAFTQNKDLFKKYEFLQMGYNFINHTPDKEIKYLINTEKDKTFMQADILMISNYFIKDGSQKHLENFIKYFKDKKKIILTSNSNIYYTKNNYKGLNYLSLFDFYLLSNKDKKKFIDKDLSPKDIYKINNYYFNLRLKDKIKEINNRLNQISKKHDIKFLLKQDFQCQMKKKICYGATEEGIKIHWDTTHFTLEGAKFFGKKIYDLNWFKLN